MRDYIDSLCQLTTGIDAVNFSDADGAVRVSESRQRLIRDPISRRLGWVANVTINDLSGSNGTIRSSSGFGQHHP